jgi:hypothetical protein
VASSLSDFGEHGYATPMALVLSVGLALIVSALVARNVEMLYLSKADLERDRQEFGLDGAHFIAASTIVRHGEPGPFRWTVTTDVGHAEVIAEFEADKIALSAAHQADDEFEYLHVADAVALKARLTAAGEAAPIASIASLDASPLWQKCADSVFSAYGDKTHLAAVAYHSPGTVASEPAWHIGEAWRVRITTSAGWRDERIVRFTGDPQHPAATVHRDFGRVTGGGDQCEEILMSLRGG